jgi:hypothetical protein
VLTHRWLPALLVVLSSTAFPEHTYPAWQNRDSHPLFPAASSPPPPLTLIAQHGKGVWYQMMEEKCREWDRNSKEAPASAAWVCVNGRPATQQETNEILQRLKREGEQNVRRWDEQRRQQQKTIEKLAGQSSRSAQIGQPNTIPQPQANQPAAPALSLRADWCFAHPQPDMLMALRVADLRHSATLQELLAQFPEPLQASARDIERRLTQLGELQEAWISVRAGDFLVLFQGRLNLPSGFVQLGNGTASYRISNTAVVIGRPDSVADAVERLSGSKAALSPSARRMNELGAGNDVWFTGTRALLRAPAVTPLANDLTGFSLGLALRDGLKLQMNLNSGTVASARRLLDAVNKNPHLPQSPVNLDTQLENRSIRLTLAVGKPQLMKAFGEALSSPWGQQLTAMAAAAEQSKHKILLQGLPGGPKEILSSGQLVTGPANTAAPLGKITIQGMPGGTKVISPQQ